MFIIYFGRGGLDYFDPEALIIVVPACLSLDWMASWYPLIHLKGYCRRRHIGEAIRKDTGYMNAAIVAFNTLPTKKMLNYIKKLSPAAAQKIERQLAEKKK